MNAHRITRTLGTAAGGLLALGLGIGAALAASPRQWRGRPAAAVSQPWHDSGKPWLEPSLIHRL